MLSAAGTTGIPLPTPKGGFVLPTDVMSQTSTSKTIDIFNNTNRTLFPFIEDANTGVNPLLNQLFDPMTIHLTPVQAE